MKKIRFLSTTQLIYIYISITILTLLITNIVFIEYFDFHNKITDPTLVTMSSEQIYQDFYIKSEKIMALGLGLLTLVLLALTRLFKKRENEIRKFADSLFNDNPQKTFCLLPDIWPELEPVLSSIKQHKEEISRLERLNLVGEMAAGIGHEIRNPLTMIKGFLQLFENRQDYFQDRETFELMISELDRANSILTDFLSLAKNNGTSFDMQPINLNALIRRVYPLINVDATHNNQSVIIEYEEIPEILANPKELNQLIFNLVRNAIEANSPGQSVTIQTFKSDDNICLAVKDQGPGIAPEIIPKLGTPFMTTKENGTGLGLSICYRIAARHNAILEVETDFSGSKFTIKFKLKG